MTSSETLREIRALLKENKTISPRSAGRLTLAAIADLSDKLETSLEQQKEMRERVKNLEDKSIVLWVNAHPKLVVFCLVVAFVVTQVWGTYGPVLAKAIGMP